MKCEIYGSPVLSSEMVDYKAGKARVHTSLTIVRISLSNSYF